MVTMISTKAILRKEKNQFFTHGEISRNFTYINDIKEIIINLISKPVTLNNKFHKNYLNLSTSCLSQRIFNIGNQKLTKLLDFIKLIEHEPGINP